MPDDTSFVGSIPLHYDRDLTPVLFEPYAETLAERVAASAPGRVLETAAGAGVATRKLRDKLPDASDLVATDLNEPMLSVAKAKFAAGERIAFGVVDATALPYDDASFDAVCCQFGVMFFSDKDKAHGEARRVLRRGGVWAFNVWDRLDANPAAAVVTEVAERALGGRPLPFFQTPHGYHALDVIRASLESAGFGHVAIDILPRRVKPANLADFAAGMLVGTPLSLQIRAHGLAPETLVAEAAVALAQRFGESGEAPLRAIQIVAVAE